MTLRIGAKLPHTGAHVHDGSIPDLARTLEEAGFDSLWVGDHVVMPREIRSRYPFTEDGRATWSPATPYLDALVALALAAAATSDVALGTAVLVLPQRNPIITAKQLASIDVASGGRLTVGVGAGWLREEFDALNVPFGTRGQRLEEGIALLRACWTGEPDAFSGAHYDLPAGLLCLPTPAHEVPILVGGHSSAAIRRVATLGDGWLGQQSLDALGADEIDGVVRSASPKRIVLRIVDSAGRSDELARRLPELRDAGVDEVIVDVDWSGEPRRQLERLRTAR